MGGSLEFLSRFFGGRRQNHKKRKYQQIVVELKVRMDCDGCELKVYNALSSLHGVESVDINRKQQKVTVVGCMEDPSKVLKKAKSTGKKAEIWPYVHYSQVRYPYAHQVYDKKAPPGYVRNVDYLTHATQISRLQEEQYINMFSDDNPNACSIM